MDNLNVLLAKIFGVVLTLVGVLGFVPGITTSEGAILGIFGTNALHNVIHLASGVVLLIAGFMSAGKNARMANQVFGVVYLLVAILGFAGILVPDLINMTAAGTVTAVYDNVLHTLLAVVFLGVGFGVKDTDVRPARA